MRCERRADCTRVLGRHGNRALARQSACARRHQGDLEATATTKATVGTVALVVVGILFCYEIYLFATSIGALIL